MNKTFAVIFVGLLLSARALAMNKCFSLLLLLTLILYPSLSTHAEDNGPRQEELTAEYLGNQTWRAADGVLIKWDYDVGEWQTGVYSQAEAYFGNLRATLDGFSVEADVYVSLINNDGKFKPAEPIKTESSSVDLSFNPGDSTFSDDDIDKFMMGVGNRVKWTMSTPAESVLDGDDIVHLYLHRLVPNPEMTKWEKQYGAAVESRNNALKQLEQIERDIFDSTLTNYLTGDLTNQLIRQRELDKEIYENRPTKLLQSRPEAEAYYIVNRHLAIKLDDTDTAMQEVQEIADRARSKAQASNLGAVLVLLVAGTLALFILSKTVKSFIDWAKNSKLRLAESRTAKKEARKQQAIRTAAEEAVITETVREQVRRAAPDEFAAIRRQIVEAIEAADVEKANALIDLAERLKKVDA